MRLCALLRKNRHRLKFLVTYDNSKEIRELYDWAAAMYDKEWNYTINRTDDQKNGNKERAKEKGTRYKGKEVFIVNYDSINLGQLPAKQLAMQF